MYLPHIHGALILHCFLSQILFTGMPILSTKVPRILAKAHLLPPLLPQDLKVYYPVYSKIRYHLLLFYFMCASVVSIFKVFLYFQYRESEKYLWIKWLLATKSSTCEPEYTFISFHLSHELSLFFCPTMLLHFRISKEKKVIVENWKDMNKEVTLSLQFNLWPF